MEIYHVTKGSPIWQFKAYEYVRIDAFCIGQGIPIEMEFSHDAPEEELQAVILIEDNKPIAGCRITYPTGDVGKIERVCVIREKQKGGYGTILIEDAEKWIQEKGIKHIVINSQDRAAGFYNKLGYVDNHDVSPFAYEVHRPTKEDIEKWENERKNKPRKNLGFTTYIVEKYL
jgi:N-acetylglutamate synthase-like GNAT family acetyltransferase